MHVLSGGSDFDPPHNPRALGPIRGKAHAGETAAERCAHYPRLQRGAGRPAHRPAYAGCSASSKETSCPDEAGDWLSRALGSLAVMRSGPPSHSQPSTALRPR